MNHSSLAIKLGEEASLSVISDLQRPASGLDFEVLKLIHRGQDSHIAFARKTPKFQEIGAFPVPEIGNLKIESLIDEDAYFTVNGAFAAAYYLTSHGHPAALRKEGHLRYLNAVFVDLDVGRPGSPPDEWSAAIRGVFGLVRFHAIPPPSIVARSGRGVNIFWLLRDPNNPSLPQRARREKIPEYKAVNKRMNELLEDFGADRNAVDGARFLRIPGSVNSKSGLRVTYAPIRDRNGEIPVYTLQELQEFIGVTEPKRDRITRNRGSCPGRIAGYLEFHRKRLENLVDIAVHLKGFPKGIRRKSLLLIATSCRAIGYSEDQIVSFLEESASYCRPPFPSDPEDPTIQEIVDEVWSTKALKFGDKTLARLFGLSEQEAIALGLRVGERKKISRVAEKRALRRVQIANVLQDFGPTLSARQMALILRDRGFKCNRTTLVKELEEVRSELTLKQSDQALKLTPNRDGK